MGDLQRTVCKRLHYWGRVLVFLPRFREFAMNGIDKPVPKMEKCAGRQGRLEFALPIRLSLLRITREMKPGMERSRDEG